MIVSLSGLELTSGIQVSVTAAGLGTTLAPSFNDMPLNVHVSDPSNQQVTLSEAFTTSAKQELKVLMSMTVTMEDGRAFHHL